MEYINRKIPIILEGATGTSKSFSAEIICDLIDKVKNEGNEKINKKGKNVIKFNMSSEISIPDLFGRYVGSKNSIAGIKMKNGPFLDAYKNGKYIILDEINLATKEVIQCIEQALDSEYLSIDIPGKPLIKPIKKHKDFVIIATENPNNDLYAQKRQDLGKEFLSHFQFIYFPIISKSELINIS